MTKNEKINKTFEQYLQSEEIKNRFKEIYQMNVEEINEEFMVLLLTYYPLCGYNNLVSFCIAMGILYLEYDDSKFLKVINK